MNDHELDELIREASPVSAGRIASLDLRDAQSELMETIMAIPDTEIDAGTTGEVLRSPRPPDLAAPPGRRPRAWFVAIAAAAAVVMAVVAVRLAGDEPGDVVTQPPAEEPSDVPPRLLAGELPPGFTLANTETRHDGGPGGVTDDESQPIMGHTAYYSEPVAGDDGLAYMSVGTALVDDASQTGGSDPLTGAVGPAPPARDVTVRGQQGRVGSTTQSGATPLDTWTTINVAWMESPRVIGTLSVTDTDLTEDDVLAIAESLFEATEEEWQAAQHLNDTPSPEEVEALIPTDAQASVTIDLGGTAVYLAADGQVCTTALDGRGQVPVECADPDGTRTSLFKDRIGFPSVLYGVLPEGASNVVATRGGVDIEAPGDVGPPPPRSVFLDPTADGSPTLYAISVAALMPPDLLTFVDAQGQPVETVPLDIRPDL